MGQQISLGKFAEFKLFVDKITYIEDEMSKFVNKFKPWIIGLPD